MTQLGLGLDLTTKRTRKREFLDEMGRVMPWSRLIALIEPHYPKGKTGRPPFPIRTVLQIHFMQQWSRSRCPLIAAPSCTKNGSSTGDPEMHSTQKAGNWYFGMKSHFGVDAESGLVHAVIGTAHNVHDITVAQALLHGEEADVYADAGYKGIEKHCEAQAPAPALACCDETGQAQNAGI